MRLEFTFFATIEAGATVLDYSFLSCVIQDHFLNNKLDDKRMLGDLYKNKTADPSLSNTNYNWMGINSEIPNNSYSLWQKQHDVSACARARVCV